MSDTSGEGFPNSPQVGHEHLQVSTGLIYEYVGGNPSAVSSWKVKDGTNAFCHISSLLTQLPSTTNPTQVTFEVVDQLQNLTYDGIGQITVIIPGVYILTTHGQIQMAGPGFRRVTMWFRLNGQDIIGSPVTNSVSGSSADMRVLRNYRTQVLNAGDTIQVFQEIEATGIALGLYPQAVGIGPVAPSAKVTMFRLPI